jgi:hypothetical protein
MSKRGRDLPKPKKTPFGKNRHEDEGQDDLLMADRMALAAAEGRLDECLEQEIPEGEYARKLTTMMMGMTGILPQEGASADDHQKSSTSKAADTERVSEGVAAPAVPEDVAAAARAGDVEQLKELLAREKGCRTAGRAMAAEEDRTPGEVQPSPSIFQKDLLDALIRVAADNGLTVDWLLARALKLYLEEYQKTGRL